MNELDYRKVYTEWCDEFQKYKKQMQQWQKGKEVCWHCFVIDRCFLQLIFVFRRALNILTPHHDERSSNEIVTLVPNSTMSFLLKSYFVILFASLAFTTVLYIIMICSITDHLLVLFSPFKINGRTMKQTGVSFYFIRFYF